MAHNVVVEVDGKQKPLCIAHDATMAEIARTIKHTFGVPVDTELHYSLEDGTPLAMGPAAASKGFLRVAAEPSAAHKDWHDRRLAITNADTHTDGSSSDGLCSSDGGRSGGTALGLPAVPINIAAPCAQPPERRIALTVSTFYHHPVRNQGNPPVQRRKVYVVADSLEVAGLLKLVLAQEELDAESELARKAQVKGKEGLFLAHGTLADHEMNDGDAVSVLSVDSQNKMLPW